ncbi:peptidoglycan-associated lipoprotein Pal [Candidatus Aalborgicola defluviihabitans]|jgi:peptidoglycan-associated lipoprotein|uniref:peptidoglycan-associated lipoprotein Pal n=1 Tax=Candidatus Aalborgicola defluviihabitans TaxID=3386187 RepID=UPI001E106CCD|nr:peptidoglycan-associated lipoprotein Pal [Burkholderiales bacterium]MBK6567687.1 peptidoglycan-associated lipoprotein Pal [Burkholderiales bacterium]MBK7282269.1 peptidoglycan-associated lipoprotein Pal [Burkholderiales bacterium]MBL0245161.1 peptidoglycan-associated lipoprotein Pal [Rhodoferax sp.]
MNRLIWAAAVAVLLSACSSGVRLNDVPVEDKSGTDVSQTLVDPNASSRVGQSTVTGVALDNAHATAAMMATNRTVYFDYDSFAIRPEAQPVIEAHSKFIKADASRKVAIEGHTDERGGREYNLALGQKRAEAVRRAMSLLGVSENQIEAVSFGKEKPAVLGSTEDAMAKNRRAEINYR